MARRKHLRAVPTPVIRSKVVLDEADAAAVEKLRAELAGALMQLGAVREEMLAQESRVLGRVSKARTELTSMVDMMGQRHGLLKEDGWRFNVDSKTFEKP